MIHAWWDKLAQVIGGPAQGAPCAICTPRMPHDSLASEAHRHWACWSHPARERVKPSVGTTGHSELQAEFRPGPATTWHEGPHSLRLRITPGSSCCTSG